MIWLGISSLWCIIAIGIFLLLKHRYATLIPLQPPSPTIADHPTIAVILPARDEAHNIAACLTSLTNQNYPQEKLHIVVVDDGSRDDTASIAHEFKGQTIRVDVIEAGDLPSGWLGKSHACWVGAQYIESEWLCFLDADTRHNPELLSAAVQQAERDSVDLLSLHPRQEMLGFWERLLMPISFMTLMILLDSRGINAPSSKKAMANGQFILVRKNVYDTIGGHAAIRDQLLEDVAIARLVKSSGYKLKLLGGGPFIHTRMYVRLKTLWEGLARGGSELFGVPLTSLAVLSALLGSLFPLAFPIWRLSVAIESPDGWLYASTLLAFIGSVAWYGAHARALHTYRVPSYYLFLLPISNILIAIVNAEGIIRRLRGQRLWKGRTL